MTETIVQHIACAVRGGTDSQDTVRSAIKQARDADACLTFFHVLDPACLGCADLAKSSAAYREYVESARAFLEALRLEAEEGGVDRVDIVLRDGDTRVELRRFSVETDADLLVMGHPGPESGRSLFGEGEFQQFLAELDFGGDLCTVEVRRIEGD